MFFRIGGENVGKATASLIVNGNNVEATGLFVEHYQKYEVTWNGQNKKILFVQNERLQFTAVSGGAGGPTCPGRSAPAQHRAFRTGTFVGAERTRSRLRTQPIS